LSTTEQHAYRVYLLLQGGKALFFGLTFTVNMIYFVTVLELTPLQLVLVGTTLETAIFIFEVPTGIVADVYSRRLSIIIGVVLIGIAFLVEGLIPVFAAVLMSQVLWGIGYTFTSGATEAWISDEIGEGRAGEAFLRGSQAGSIGSIIGVIGAVGLAAATQINVPIATSGVLFLLMGGLLVLFMPENGFQRAPQSERSSFTEMFSTFREGLRLVRRRPVLISILVIGVILGIASEGYDRLWHKHLIDTITLPGPLEPIIWFGALDLVGIAIGLAFKEVARRRVNLNSHAAVAQATMRINLFIAVCIVVLALAGNLLVALVAILLIGPLRGTSGPIFTAWINQSLDPKVRATVLSMSGQVDALGQIAGGPAVGAIGNLSVRAALAVSGIIWAAATPLFRRSLRYQPVAEPAQ
jgi:MFS transporter, DHA3 family, tetracycline resistance protein